MKRKKLNARGFSHHLVMVVFVVTFAICGVAYLVASHAASCNTTVSGPSSSPTSSSVSQPASGGCKPTSGPVSGSAALYCKIPNMPTNASYGTTLIPSIYVSNNGSQTITPSVYASLNTISSNGSQTVPDSITIALKPLGPGQSVTQSLPLTYKVPYSTASVSKVSFQATLNSKIANCTSQIVNLPATPATSGGNKLAPADSATPASSTCSTAPTTTNVTVAFGIDVPNPRCQKVTGSQTITISNPTKQTLNVTFGGYSFTLQPYTSYGIYVPLNTYLAQGVHKINSNIYTGSEIWLQ